MLPGFAVGIFRPARSRRCGYTVLVVGYLGAVGVSDSRNCRNCHHRCENGSYREKHKYTLHTNSPTFLVLVLSYNSSCRSDSASSLWDHLLSSRSKTGHRIKRSLAAGCTTGSFCPRCPCLWGRVLSLYLALVFSVHVKIRAPEADASARRHSLSAYSGSKGVCPIRRLRLQPSGCVAERRYTLPRWTSAHE